MITVNDVFVRENIKKRDRNAHKGNFGKVLIFAGSVGMAGAAVLAGKAALKSGAGLVRFLIPSFDSPLLHILQISVPEATCVPYSDNMDFNEYTSIAAGPGLGQETIVRSILCCILEKYSGRLVLDADALNMISGSEILSSLVRNSSADIIMTPHVGEARRLIGDDSCDFSGDEGRINAHGRLAHMYSSIIVLKGAGTITGYGEDLFLNTTGNPGMATGGSGDVLTGIIASLNGQGYSSLDSAVIGTWIHGKAGDIAAEKLGEISLISSDIVQYIPEAFLSVY